MNSISIMFAFDTPPKNPFAPLSANQHIKLVREIPNFNTLPMRLSEKILPIAKERVSFGNSKNFDEICLVLQMVEQDRMTEGVKLREDYSERCLFCTKQFDAITMGQISTDDRESYLFELCLEAIESIRTKYSVHPPIEK